MTFVKGTLIPKERDQRDQAGPACSGPLQSDTTNPTTHGCLWL